MTQLLLTVSGDPPCHCPFEQGVRPPLPFLDFCLEAFHLEEHKADPGLFRQRVGLPDHESHHLPLVTVASRTEDDHHPEAPALEVHGYVRVRVRPGDHAPVQDGQEAAVGGNVEGVKLTGAEGTNVHPMIDPERTAHVRRHGVLQRDPPCDLRNVTFSGGFRAFAPLAHGGHEPVDHELARLRGDGLPQSFGDGVEEELFDLLELGAPRVGLAYYSKTAGFGDHPGQLGEAVYSPGRNPLGHDEAVRLGLLPVIAESSGLLAQADDDLVNDLGGVSAGLKGLEQGVPFDEAPAGLSLAFDVPELIMIRGGPNNARSSGFSTRDHLFSRGGGCDGGNRLG